MISGSGLAESAALARESLSAAGVKTVSEKKLVNGSQVVLSMAGLSCRVNYYWSVRKGFSTVPAGGDPDLIEFAMGVLSGEAELPPLVEGFRIGTDEAGKGDWFGPLVAAGVACDDGVAGELAALGVADSKTLSNDRVLKLASALTARPGLAWEVRCISPGEYNTLFEHCRTRGMNSLDMQAMAHGEVITRLLARTGAGTVVVDRFCPRERLAPWLPPGDYRLSLRFRAEDDPVVAAASIIARGAYLRELEKLSEGLAVSLSSGSGAAADKVGVELVKLYGQDILASLAKVHFSNYFRASSP